MSQNVESMRRSYEAFNLALSTGDDLRPLMENIDPDIVVEMVRPGGDLSRSRTPQAVRRGTGGVV